MEIAGILALEVGVMLLLIAVGVVCKVKNIINEENARALSNLLLLIVIPVIILRNLQTELIPELLPAMGLTIVATVLFHMLSIFVANRLFRDPGDGSTAWRVSRLGAVFANCGFMGFPLLQATVGDVGLLYGVIFLGTFNVISWVWSVPTLTGARSLSPKQLATNPAIVSFVIGVILFLLQIRLPALISSALGYISGVNTPLSMVITGVFLASVKPREALGDKRVYVVMVTRNLILPLIALLILWAARVSLWLPGGRDFALSFIILISCATAANTILMSARYNCDSAHGAKLVAASTVASIVTLPLVALLADVLL